MDQLQAKTGLAVQLVKTKACTEDVADELVKASLEQWIPLGMILVKRKKLRIRDLSRILSYQALNPRELFGDVAVLLGICTEADITDALRHQDMHCPHVLDLALHDERVDQARLMQAIRLHIRGVERLVDRLDDALLVAP